VLLVAGCGEAAPTSATSVDLHDGRLEASSTVLRPGPVDIDIRNAGEFPHTLVITTGDGMVVTATGLVAPGEELEMAVTLDPGTYQFTCRIVSQTEDGRILDHYQLGMAETVTVG